MNQLDAMLLEWEDRRSRGEPAGADVLCPDDTVLQLELAERIRILEAFDALMAPASPTLVPPTEPPLPERFGRYEVRREIGSGGMGIVYEAWDPVLEHAVAVKALRPGRALSSRRARDRFERERRLLARFARKSIVAALDAGDEDGIPYLVMDYLPGGSLAAHHDRLKSAGPAAIAALMGKVARAADDAHSVNVLHRDLKPGNVLLDEKGDPFIADFGLAAILAGDECEGDDAAEPRRRAADATTLRGAGTPGYMAPEQFDHLYGPVGKPADVWALGVMLHELLTGRRPFAADDLLAAELAVTMAPLPPLRGVPRPLAAIVARCLEKQPEKRFQSAGELAGALEQVQQPTRRRALQVGAAGVLALGGGLAWWALRPPRLESTPPDPEFDGYTDVDAIRDALAKLERGETVVFVDRGRPVPAWRLTLGPSSGSILSGPEYPFGVQPNGYCLVEFLPRLPPGEWLVEATLEHVHSQDSSRVGVAAGISRAPGADGWTAQAWVLGFHGTAIGEPGVPIEPAGSSVILVAREAVSQPFPGRETMIGVPRTIPPGPNPGPPRLQRIAAVVSETAVSGRIGEERFPALELGRFAQERNAMLDKHPLPPGSAVPETTFRGGIGVFAKNGVLRVEQFTVRPRPPAS